MIGETEFQFYTWTMITPDQVIYLDNNATTQLDPAVLEEMQPFVTQFYGNPSSGYQFGAQVRKAIDRARDRVAGLLECEPGEIVFTSCGTESNNAAINSALQIDPSRKHVVTTAVEHSAVLRHCQALANRGYEVTFLKVSRDGDVDLAELEQAIRPDTAIVSAMWANNETGVLFPIDAIAQICREKRILFHTDAVQAVGKIPLQLRDAGIHFLSLSAHKFHGPKGVGALYVNRGVRFRPLIFGGGQENGRRAGTENVGSIVGLGKAAERAGECLAEEDNRVRAMRDRFEGVMLKTVKSTSINGHGARRLPNTSSVSFDGIDASAALLLLDRHRLCCSAGSACRTGSTEGSHVLRAMQLSAERTRGSLRFSFGRFNSDGDVDQACASVPEAIKKLRQLSPPPTPERQAALQTLG
jgi:cysteine desulfurase